MNFRKILSITFIFFLAFTVEAFSLSPAEKAKKNYQFTLLLIRTFRIPVENFAPSENLSQYDKIKEAFFEARENFYGQNYVVAYQKYATMKADLIPFATDLAQNYLTRTKDLLDAATKYSANLLTDYTKSTPILRDIKEPRNPVRNEQVYKDDYTPKTYHLFYHGRIIETYIKEGYSTYYQAKNLFDDPEIEYMKQNEKRSPEDMDYILERYLSIIKLCRTSKQYGVEVYKLYNINDLADLSAQNNNISTINLDPTIDVRIPDKYRIDAVDNRNLVYKGKKEEQTDKKE
ncbi:MAG: hypothetical protein LBT84_07465 [Spirochaetia bacterium]|jgi:hypothetical protein|nr:hypothetical protein [Spirochaetia bacterium]